MSLPSEGRRGAAEASRAATGAEHSESAHAGSGEKPERVWVEAGAGRRPFMRGIMIHSLMARGVSFEEANDTANLSATGCGPGAW